MDFEGVSLPLIHNHIITPWNDLRKGDGYYCKICDLFFQKKYGESSTHIEHPSHSGHTLRLQHGAYLRCRLCGRSIVNRQCYRCETCDFDIDVECAQYPPPEVIDVSETHHQKLTLLKEEIKFDCDAQCGKIGYGFHYKCYECDVSFHVNCIWNLSEVNHPYQSLHPPKLLTGHPLLLPMDSEEVSLPIHEHIMIPWHDLRKGDCCRSFEAISDGYYCKSCDFFVHKKCAEAPESMEHQSHSSHTLTLQGKPDHSCDLCGRVIENICYRCDICDFDVDLHCAKHPPPEVIENSETHHHKLTLYKEKDDLGMLEFDCDAKCGTTGKYGTDGFPYKCQECDLTYHIDCVQYKSEVKYLPEVNHSYHSLHPLKLFTGQPPDYSDGKCRLCGRKIDRSFYHCSSCNFTLGMCCVLHPPPQSLMDLKTHDHQLSLLPRLISFTCNACGLKGDRSPYACFQCDFMIHKTCFGLPRLININRHDHRVSRASRLNVVNSVCGVCRQKVDWSCGGYICQRCPGYVVHSKCATRDDVWNGQELEGVLEETEDIEPYVVIDDNTIQYFSHKEHYLRLHVNGVLSEANKRCSACNHPICPQPFYGCMDCDFILHQNCAESPRKKWHVLHNERLTLDTSEANFFTCGACRRMSNGFAYQCGNRYRWIMDVKCASISEPFVHPSHPHHPLYYVLAEERTLCNGCNKWGFQTLKCIEDDCGFCLDFKCATLPIEVKHRVDDHPLSLCYGEEASGKYWCDICEKETNPDTWFYTCKDNRASLHTNCVLGDISGLMPGSKINSWGIPYEVVLNNSITRPFCKKCKSHCIYPLLLKVLGTSDTYFCSDHCT